ncbi:MAG TPA: M20/M25/M40 family metallo-hydrolase [Baekduia sp.]|uniref:M20 family metallopeptidase n=1 Tax=Baekduia sp. TaxID=2600305 RepID=UPI002D7926EA|nr:M20/M25/M40 family metallo-hydrolase [Baekduia sp.]HET6505364.1 M20/M25/M40 family metallo-hydrolase [Baekduia sp.]
MPGPAVDLALELVRLDTINPPGREAAAAELLARRLERAGLEVERHEHAPGRTSLVARLAGDGRRPPLCLTGHLDTVPLGGAPWTVPPFGELRDGRLHGRGASDMKGGVAAIVVAAERVAAEAPGPALELVLCAGEETGCEGARHLVAAGALGRAGAVLVAEPTGGVPHLGHKGVLWVNATAEGVAAHGSAPHLGRNAIVPLASAVAAIADVALDATEHPLLGGPTLSIGTISGGTVVNAVPDRARAGIDVRTVPGMSTAAVLEVLAAAAGPEITLTPWVDLAPVVTDAADPFAALCRTVAEEVVGVRPTPRGLSYFTDAAALTPAYGGPPTVIWGPGEAAQAHQTDEWADAARIEAAADAFAAVARRWGA